MGGANLGHGGSWSGTGGTRVQQDAGPRADAGCVIDENCDWTLCTVEPGSDGRCRPIDPRPYCLVATGACVQCLEDANCRGKPCLPGHRCAECVTDNDCPKYPVSGSRCSNGVCGSP